MISEAEIERALDYLRDNAEADAQARANSEYLGEWRKVERSRIVTEQSGMSTAAATAYAEAHPDYLRALSAWRAAITEDYRRRFLREAAGAKIEAYRTQEATKRAEGRMYGNG